MQKQAFAFGAYAGRLLGFGASPNALRGSTVVLISGLNLSGVRKSGISEDMLVCTKILILTGLDSIGFVNVSPEKVYPIVNMGIGSMSKAEELVFVAYEGFQLLTYDCNTIVYHKNNLPRAVIISTQILVAFVLTGSLALT